MGSGRGQARRAQIRSTGFKIGNAFDQKYHEAINYLDENFTYFLTHVLNAGKPRQSGIVPTACVALPTKSTRLEDFEFHFNPDFAETLDDEEMGFVLAHETMHVLLNHLELGQHFDNPQIFNLAADAVINDYLVDLGLEMVEGGVTGEALVGHSCAHSTVAEVYAEIKQEVDKQQQQQGGDGEGKRGGGQGQPGQGDPPTRSRARWRRG
jgi:predicted metal-dependent peptidase